MQETSNLIGNQKLHMALRNIKSFQHFSDDDLRSFLDLGRLRRYEPGEMIIMEDDNDSWVYFLLSGQVKIIKEGRHIQTLNQGGDIFGEMGVMDGLPRSASIQANSSTLVLGLDGSLIAKNSASKRLPFYFSIFRYFAKVLTMRLRSVSDENSKLRAELYQKENLLRQHTRSNDLIV